VKIFVSYSRRDAGDFANQIQRHLSSFKYDIFTDVHSIKAGETWSNIIEENISKCDIFVAIVTYGALQSSHVENEVLQAQNEKKTIIPCFHKDISINDIKWGLEKIQGVEFDDKYELARNIRSKIADSKDIVGIFGSFSKIKENSITTSNKDYVDLDKKLQKKDAIEEEKSDPKSIRISDEQKKSFVNYPIKKNRRGKAKIIIASILAFFILGFIILVVYNVIISNEINKLTDKGYEFDDLGEYTRAIEYYNKALDIDPNYLYALNGKGWALNELGNFKEAIVYYDKALEEDPNYADALNNKGYALYKQDKYQQAIEYFDKALDIDPNYLYALNGKGWALNRQDKYQQAIEYFDKALEIDPNDKYAFNGKGWALYKQDKYQQAIEYFDKALEIDPNFKTSLYNKASALSSQGNNQEAIKYLDKALEIDPNDKFLLTVKGWALITLNDYQGAIEYFDKALEIDPNYTPAQDFKKAILEDLQVQ
jgi:tetratricopeptide (TPR) repeat protein